MLSLAAQRGIAMHYCGASRSTAALSVTRTLTNRLAPAQTALRPTRGPER
jgi:hypothetical protein